MEHNRSCKSFKQMCSLKNSPAINIGFQDLSYLIKGGGEKYILKSISGKFYSGELTAILRASGSGKTTLLNILAGYITNGVTGSITVNGKRRIMKLFHKITAYIMQEDLLQPYLSVGELMMFAAKLKLGDHISLEGKAATVTEVLKLFGLEDCRETRTDRISGGQRKRLSIALELVNNPPVIFLDEPTSGLDSVSVKHCIDILKILTGQGRTVICTIHQPSSYVFQSFNHVYFIQNGMCVYNGSTSNLTPFMCNLGYECPITYNPADYIIETVQTVEESALPLVNGIQNGKLSKRDSKALFQNDVLFTICEGTVDVQEARTNVDFPTSFWTQFSIIFSRMLLQMRRNSLMLCIQLFYYTLCGVFFGALFYRIGNNASLTVANFKLCACIMIFFVYPCLMSAVLLIPLEIVLLKREYFNRWYGLKPYVLAMTLINLPLMLILGTIFITVTYFLSDQPMELNRWIWFCFASILAGVASEALGTAIGCICSITVGSVVAPIVGAMLLFFSIYGMGYGQFVGPVMKIVMYTSYMRLALTTMVVATFGNRQLLECTNEIFCYYQDPKRLLRDLGMQNSSCTLHVLGLIAYVILFRLIAYLVLRFRLTSEGSPIVVNYTKKYLHCR